MFAGNWDLAVNSDVRGIEKSAVMSVRLTTIPGKCNRLANA